MTLLVPGPPISMQRPRLSRKKVYNPQSKIKNDLIFYLRAKYHVPQGLAQYKGPVSLNISFFMPIPKSLSKVKQKRLLNQPHICRPDLDNLVKFYCDLCTNLLYFDDASIYTITSSKVYSLEPRTEISILYEEK